MSQSPRRHAFTLSLIVAAALGAGCASSPQAPAPAPAPQVQPLAEYMSEAAKAKADRLNAKERDTYRTAARLYPTAKEPWMRLAESYFDAGDYGNAILAAQEVLQRDAADPVAASVLAVSGLRVSTQALSALRTQNGSLPGDSRTQAENLTKTLRELLGENVLVPQASEAPVAPAPAPAPRRPRPATANAPATTTPAPAAATRPAGATAATPAPAATARPAGTTAATPAPVPPTAKPAAAAAPAPAAPAPAPAKPPPAKNPFDALK